MSVKLSRRSFLQMSGLTAGALLINNLPFKVLAQQGTELVIGINAQANNMDPHHEGGTIANGRHWNMVFDSLTRTMSDGSIGPALATEWSSSDGITWVFKLREGVVFHDGSVMTAEDVAWGIMRTLAGAQPGAAGSAQSQTAPYIAMAEATGDLEVTITATSVDPAMPLRLAGGAGYVMPRAGIEAVPYETLLWSPIGAGPFRLVEHVDAVRTVFERHEDYWMGQSPFTRVTFRYIPELATRVAALQSGDVDFVTSVTPDLVDQIENSSGLTVDSVDVPNFMQVLFNTNSAPLDNVHVRRAMSLAIDRDTLANDLWNGRTRPMNEYLLPSEEGYDSSLNLFRYDPEAAMAELQTAGYNGEPIIFTAPVTYYPNMAIISDALVAFWQAIGLNIDYQRVETEGWRENLRGGGPGITIVSAGSGGNPALRSDFRGWFAGNYADDFWTPTEEFTDIWTRANAALDAEERTSLIRQLVQIIDDNMLFAPLYQSVEFYGRRESVNWTPSQFLIDLRPDMFQSM